ncbi:MAG: uroporphyrinogen-III C-methyltransferase [Phycisphaerae bacterium]
MTDPAPNDGLVILVGAGPGDGGLMTLEGARWLSIADAVVYDRLAGDEVLQLLDEDAQRIYVGKLPGEHSMEQEQINALLIDLARNGKLVVRLKGGDPLVFGRGGEEALALSEAGVDFRIVPGITAAVAAASLAGVPLTHRGLASSAAFVTGHEDPAKEESSLNFQALAALDTLVFYMGVGKLPGIAEKLIAAGRDPSTPAVVVQDVALPTQRSIAATLGTVAEEAARAGVRPPAVVIVGQVASLQPKLDWRSQLPLTGRTVLVTRSTEQATVMTVMLQQAGARVIEAPAIRIEPPAEWDEVDEALCNLDRYDWMVFTSANGVRHFARRLTDIGLDARCLGRCRIAAVGPSTADALHQRMLTPDLVPETYTTEALGRAMVCEDVEPGDRVLLLRADLASPALPKILLQAGAVVDDVTIYRTMRPRRMPAEAVDALREGSVDWLTLCSGSSAENFVALAREAEVDLHEVSIAAIGPVTAQTLHRVGLEATLIASSHTIEGLVAALVNATGQGVDSRAPGG